jgi:hypothetical protein
MLGAQVAIHPDSDPTKLSSIVWPRPADLAAHWESEDGAEHIKKWYSTEKIAKYFRTRPPVCAADVDNCKATCKD